MARLPKGEERGESLPGKGGRFGTPSFPFLFYFSLSFFSGEKISRRECGAVMRREKVAALALPASGQDPERGARAPFALAPLPPVCRRWRHNCVMSWL